jgi:hypothetical protein
MDAKTLAKIVQIVVQEEVGKIVRKELTTMKKQIVAEIKKSIPKQELVYETTQPKVDSLDDLVGNVLQKERRKSPQPTTKTFTKNPMLNGILNETANSYNVPAEDEYTDYPTMGGETMNSNSAPMGGNATDYRAMMAEKMGMTPPNSQGTPSVQEMLPSTDPEGRPLRTQNIPDAVTKALTRDYTELVKGMNKKK